MDNKTPTPIIVVAYNRPKSLSRLLDSLSKAIYPSFDIPLIISIDKGDKNQDVLHIGENFQWKHGKKTLIYQEENLGLKKHVLQCGNMVLEYGSIIILEDDLYVSAWFYNYTIQALKFGSDRSYIGGISLYNHQYNVHVGANFQAVEDGFDNWYFQFASSWGQAYTKEQWSDFMAWYETQGTLKSHPKIPQQIIINWSDQSWLKYNIAYLIEKNKYFLYPKTSLTTNFSDRGTHAGNDSTAYQVPLLYQKASDNFYFSGLEDSFAVYDSFFENLRIHSGLGLEENELSVDLYGSKPNYDNKYLLTSKILNHKIVRTYGRCLKPMDSNIFQEIAGEDFFLYDTSLKSQNIFPKDRLREIIYNIKTISYRDTIFLLLDMTKNKFFRLVKNLSS